MSASKKQPRQISAQEQEIRNLAKLVAAQIEGLAGWLATFDTDNEKDLIADLRGLATDVIRVKSSLRLDNPDGQKATMLELGYVMAVFNSLIPAGIIYEQVGRPEQKTANNSAIYVMHLHARLMQYLRGIYRAPI